MRNSKPQDWSMGLGRKPPQDLLSEEAVICACLEGYFEQVATIIKTPETFYKEVHMILFDTFQKINNDGKDITPLQIRRMIPSQMEMIGGMFYLEELRKRGFNSNDLRNECMHLVEMAIARQVIATSTSLIKDAFNPETSDPFILVDKMNKLNEDVTRTISELKTFDFEKEKKDALEETKKRHEGIGNFVLQTKLARVDETIGGLENGSLITIAGRPGMGKCLGKDTLCIMFDGTRKKVQDVVVGDLLMGADSTKRTVLSTTTGKEMMYWVRQKNGVDYRVNESHILSLKRSRAVKNKELSVVNIPVNEYLLKSSKFKTNYKGYKRGYELLEKQLILSPYFLGVWLGDGSHIDQRITNPDVNIVNYLKEYARELDLRYSIHKSKDKCDTHLLCAIDKNKESMLDKLRYYNLLKNKHIPSDFMLNSKKNRLELLAGIIDSDGYLCTDSTTYEVVQKRKQLADDIVLLCNSLGFRVNCRKKISGIKSTGFSGEYYRINITGETHDIPVKVPYKKAKKRLINKDWRNTEIGLEKDCYDDYYGFEIDGDRLFLIEDGTVTHNTCVGIQLLYNVGFIQKIPVALFTLEMSNKSILNRLLANHTNFSNFEIKAGFKGAVNRMNDYLERATSFSSEHIHIYDQIFEIDSIVAKGKELIKNKGVQLILVDYLQLAEAPDKGNREQEVSYMSRQLKKLALEGDIPVIAFAQLSRAVETRGGNKIPQLSDLRESGSIEQDSDNVVFLHRPYYYNKEADFHELTWINAKNRNGSNEDAKLYCDIPYNQIRDHKVDINVPGIPVPRNEHQALRQLLAFSDELDDTPF